jgi:hypothetical protein
MRRFQCRSEDDLQSQLDIAAASIEDAVVQEEIPRIYEHVRGRQWIGILERVYGSVVCRQTDTEIGVIERIEAGNPELQLPSLGNRNVLEERHIPNVQAPSRDGVTS